MMIAIVGFGGMGQVVEQTAKQRGHEVVSIIDPNAEGATHKEIGIDSTAKADVCIDFTQPSVAMENIAKYCELGKSAVIGTTGWYEHLDKAKESVEKAGIGLLWAGNFSLGVNTFYRIIEAASKAIDKLPEYDVMALERHHNKKKDSPSGTAKMIEKILLENIKRKEKAVEEKLDRQIDENELHFASIRGGHTPGIHSVIFDSSADTIELTHTNRNREGLALGAVKAAEFLEGKKGFFGIDDLMKDILEG